MSALVEVFARAFGPDVAQDMIARLGTGNHTHVCPCGAILVCMRPIEGCAIGGRQWSCETCDEELLQAYLSVLAGKLSGAS